MYACTYTHTYTGMCACMCMCMCICQWLSMYVSINAHIQQVLPAAWPKFQHLALGRSPFGHAVGYARINGWRGDGIAPGVWLENDPFIDGLPIKNGDFPWQNVSSPEGKRFWKKGPRLAGHFSVILAEFSLLNQFWSGFRPRYLCILRGRTGRTWYQLPRDCQIDLENIPKSTRMIPAWGKTSAGQVPCLAAEFHFLFDPNHGWEETFLWIVPFWGETWILETWELPSGKLT